jgi:hypothetical protein
MIAPKILESIGGKPLIDGSGVTILFLLQYQS